MKDTIQDNINNSYYFGCIKYKNEFSFYLMPVQDWILSYDKYDPGYNPDDWEYVFRDNILNVDDSNIERYLLAIDIDKIDIKTVDVSYYNLDKILLFYIDFDSKTFINYFDDISIEDYLPDEHWVGRFDNPLLHLPPQILDKLK